MWSAARYDLGLTEPEFWLQTPKSLNALLKRRRMDVERHDVRSAMLAALFYNAWRGKGRPKGVEDFMLSPVEKPQPSSSMLKQKAIALFTAMGLKPKGLKPGETNGDR